MSQYSSIIKKLQKFITSKNIITDTGSTKRNIINIINKNNKIKDIFIPSHPIAGSEVSGPKYGNKDLFTSITSKGVVADWREPDVIRIAPVPLYNSFEDVFGFYEILKKLL